MIDNKSEPGTWKEQLAIIAQRQAENLRITEMNERIKAASKKRDYCPHETARIEGVGIDYVNRIAVIWER